MKVSVYTRRMEGHSVLTYTYWFSPDGGFRTNLLCEVGQPWLPAARAKAEELAKKRNSVIKQVELTKAPWYVDALVKETA